MSRNGSGGAPRTPGDSDQLSASARRELRALYAAPAADAYWEGLEARVMARVRGVAGGRITDDWSAVLAGWARTGIAIAAAAALVAGIALAAARRQTERLNAQAVAVLMEEPASVPAVAATGPDEGRAREATLQYLVTH